VFAHKSFLWVVGLALAHFADNAAALAQMYEHFLVLIQAD
jgi:hypothetical protein